MKIEDFGGLQTAQGHIYFYEPMHKPSADGAIVILSNSQATTLLDAYHKREPLKTSFDCDRYGAFQCRDEETQTELITHVFGGPLQPFSVERFNISGDCVGYTRGGFRALTHAITTMGLPLIPIEVATNELEDLQQLVGTPQQVMTTADFYKQRGEEFPAVKSGYTPAQSSYMKNFPYTDEDSGEIRKAAELGLFLVQHQVNAVTNLPAQLRHYGLDANLAAATVEHAQAQERSCGRRKQLNYLTELVSTIYELDRRGINLASDDVSALHLMDMRALRNWSDANLQRPAYPLCLLERQAVETRQYKLIAAIPIGVAESEPAKIRLHKELRAFRQHGSGANGPTPV